MNTGRLHRIGKTNGSGRLTRDRAWILPVLLGLALLLLCPGAQADEVTMTNGDVITGEITVLKDGKLTIKTPYNEALEIAWGSVKEIRSEKPVEVVLSDGTRLKGILEMNEEGEPQVVTESAGTVTISAMGKIAGINPPVVPPVTYHGNLQAGVSYLTGNTDTTSGNLSGLFVAKSKGQRFTLRGKWYYAENDNVVSAREADGSVQYDFFVTEKVYTFASAFFQYNPFRDLNLRSAFSGGVGYQFFDKDRIKLSADLGVSYVDEDFRVAPDDSYTGGRWSLTFDYWIIEKKIEFFHYQQGFYSFEDFADMNLISQQGLRFTVLKDFYTNFEVDVSYDNKPSPGFEKTDTALIFGLGYDFDL